MHKAKIRAVGGSAMVAIPPVLLDALQLAPNASVDLAIDGNRLIITPQPRKGRIGLAARLALCDYSKPAADDERAWIDAPRVGREVL
jgi:antitoxin ChpS